MSKPFSKKKFDSKEYDAKFSEIRRLLEESTLLNKKLFKKILKLDQNHDVYDFVYSGIALEFYFAGEYDLALQAFFKAAEAIDFEPEEERRYLKVIFGETSMIYEAQQKYQEAYEMEKKSLETAIKYYSETEYSVQGGKNGLERLERIVKALEGFKILPNPLSQDSKKTTKKSISNK